MTPGQLVDVSFPAFDLQMLARVGVALNINEGLQHGHDARVRGWPGL